MKYKFEDIQKIYNAMKTIAYGESKTFSNIVIAMSNIKRIDEATDSIFVKMAEPALVNFMDELLSVGIRYAVKKDGRVLTSNGQIVIERNAMKDYENDIKDLYKRKKDTYQYYMTIHKRLNSLSNSNIGVKLSRFKLDDIAGYDDKVISVLRMYKLTDKDHGIINRAAKVWAKLYKR